MLARPTADDFQVQSTMLAAVPFFDSVYSHRLGSAAAGCQLGRLNLKIVGGWSSQHYEQAMLS
jgi:hypothetical protein